MVYLPEPLEVFPSNSINLLYKQKHTGYEQYEKNLRDICSRQNINFFSLKKPIYEENISRGECSHGFDNNFVCNGHFNEYGHQLVAQLLVKRIEANKQYFSTNN